MQRRTFLTASFATTVAATLGLATPLRAVATPAELLDRIQTSHPRLYLTDFDAVHAKVATDPVARWFDRLAERAEEIAASDPVTYDIPDGLRLLDVSREMLRRSFTLGMVFEITGEQKYADALWANLEAVAAFPDWNPRHFLDTAEMTHAVAVGYDWLHGAWSPNQRSTLEAALLEHGLRPGLEIYRSGDIGEWPHRTTNWNLVGNAGMITGALALAHTAEDVAAEVLGHAFESLPRAIAEYGPSGGYGEGVMYWGYATQYLVAALATLASATGADHELADSPGVDRTGYFPLHMTGTSGDNFNFYDANTGAPRDPELMWLARTYSSPEMGWWGRTGADLDPHALNLVWYDAEFDAGPATTGLSRDSHFARVEAASMRSAWQDQNAVYVGAKGGDDATRTGHADLDLGTFVLDAFGTRWVTEFIEDDYNLPGYFDKGGDGQRWTYYRRRAEGQNTVVFSAPGSVPDQVVTAVGPLLRRESSPEDAFTIFDLTSANEGLRRWHRGFRLTDARRQLLIQDEIELDGSTSAWWFLHTLADLEISEDGREATLSRNGHCVVARLVEPSDGVFLHADAAPLWDSPHPEGQDANAFHRKLTIRLPEVTSTRVLVVLSPVPRGGEPGRPPRQRESLARWSLPAPGRTASQLSALSVDGVPIKNFRPEVFTYTVATAPDAAVPALAAEPADQRGRVTVQPPEQIPGVARVRVRTPGNLPADYHVSLQPDLTLPGSWDGLVAASADDGNRPEYTLDGDLDTRWSALGDGQWIAYDLGADDRLEEVHIAFFNGHRRSSSFDIEVAADGEDWHQVYTGQSSGETAEPEPFTFDAVTARYLRIVCYGNTANAWCSITELSVPGRPLELPPAPASYTGAVLSGLPAVLSPAEVVTAEPGAGLSDGTAADLAGAEIELISSDPAVIAVEGLELRAVSTGEADIHLVLTTADHRLLHTSTSVAVQ